MRKFQHDHQIGLQQAIDMTTLYRANRPSDFPVCETFSLVSIQSLISNEEAAFFRIYYGMKEDMSVHAILVVADSAGNDLLPLANRSEAEEDDNEILEDSVRCPNACPPDSPLNQP